ncbi:uncharacterized protein MYCFIDRAFT_212426 [Pseudocercospora fijiensis CIRAD86]|uniref:Uncharacterized protein n=1 Tax=Pseudocercospora fijiensis (strain CIRAD86) TaxID=383855 RepID=M2ZHH0_PSEFD|nr:uncharacterized protein MYCFIDRAFT_212426 [Pseudocercospora fijiensis CIRAD86]EME78584.1 hypothetical protein MYCFIDRAFT_212426 [Pseudocercospora fijiensis CIRAD86]
MLYRRLFPRALSTLHIAASRNLATKMAVPPQNFTLDPKIFNPTLYTHLRDFWFQGLPPDSKCPNEETNRRWWGVGRSETEAKEIDSACHSNYAHALESISPAHLSLPPDADPQKLASPFLPELQTHETEKEAADTFLSLILLLDQIPRNIYRTPPNLSLVYTHYDRLALSLRLHAPPNLLNHPYYKNRPVYNQWLNMPLMHSENLADQKQVLSHITRDLEIAKEEDDGEGIRALEMSVGPARKHWEIVERFGRFPHRNECLGRESSEEERVWLGTGETFGVRHKGQEQEQEEKKKEKRGVVE